MKIGANAIRSGDILEHNGKLYIVSKTPVHTMPGKGGAFVQVEMKEIKSGTKLNERFRSDENVEKARLDEIEYQFLYADNDSLYFMSLEDFEQIQLDKEVIGHKAIYLKDGMKVTLSVHEGVPLSAEIPQHVTLEVTETEPVVKGQTAASSYKPAILENGLRTMVPPFVDAGTKIIVNTNDDTYVERAK